MAFSQPNSFRIRRLISGFLSGVFSIAFLFGSGGIPAVPAYAQAVASAPANDVWWKHAVV